MAAFSPKNYRRQLLFLLLNVAFFSIFCFQQPVSIPIITLLDTNPIKAKYLWNVNPICWCFEYCYWLMRSWPLEKWIHHVFFVWSCSRSEPAVVVYFKVQITLKCRHLKAGCSFNVKIICIDELQIITESKLFSDITSSI